MDEPSWRELELLAKGDVRRETFLGLMSAGCAEDILARIDPAIDYILRDFSRCPKERQNRSEDGLTVDLISCLNAMTFDESHDTTTGGHCDIVIEGRFGVLWLGEAKIHSNHAWLLSGFNQLDKRYATAVEGQDRGGIIIYHYGARSDRVMNSWQKHLLKARPEITVIDRKKGDLVMNTQHVHRRTGRSYHVRHVIASLYWNPED